MEELKACQQKSEALDIIEGLLDVADMKCTGPLYADDPPRNGLCRIPEEDAAILRQYIAARRAVPENDYAALKAQYDEINRYNISCTKKIDELLAEKLDTDAHLKAINDSLSEQLRRAAPGNPLTLDEVKQLKPGTPVSIVEDGKIKSHGANDFNIGPDFWGYDDVADGTVRVYVRKPGKEM